MLKERRLQAQDDQVSEEPEKEAEEEDELAGFMKDLENSAAYLPTQTAEGSASSAVIKVDLSAGQLEGMKKLQQQRKEAKVAKDKEKKEKGKKKGAIVASVIGGKLKAAAKKGPAKTLEQTDLEDGAKA